MVRILISGIFGHMGRNVAELVEADKDCELLCGVDLKAGEMNGAPVYASFADVKEKADAVIDFSSAANLANVLSYAEKFGVPVVLAATGYTEADLKAIDEASKKVAMEANPIVTAVVTPNKSSTKTPAKMANMIIQSNSPKRNYF